MKYKNNTNENIKYRIGTYESGFDWFTIRPGKIVDLPGVVGKKLPLTIIDNKIGSGGDDGKKKVHKKTFEKSNKDKVKPENYKGKLSNIKRDGLFPIKKIMKKIIKGKIIHKKKRI